MIPGAVPFVAWSWLLGVIQADGEGRLVVSLRVAAERDVRVGVQHARDLADLAGHQGGEILVLAHPHERDQVHVTCAGVHLRDAVDVGDLLCRLGNAFGGGLTGLTTAYELTKAKNQIEAQFVFAQDSNFYQAMLLARFELIGDWRGLDSYLPAVRKVTAEDVKRVAREYLVADRRTVGILVPTGPARTAAPPPSEMLH